MNPSGKVCRRCSMISEGRGHADADDGCRDQIVIDLDAVRFYFRGDGKPDDSENSPRS